MPRLLFIVFLAILFAGCWRSQRVQVAAPAIPFTKQLQMQKGDAYEFQLPNGKMVAVWCEQPEFGMMWGEQATKSGLKTAWGERAFKRPESLMRQIGRTVTSLLDESRIFCRGQSRLRVIGQASMSCLSATCGLPSSRI